jgi:hypothetical protein
VAFTSSRKFDLPLYDYDLSKWFVRFASCLRAAPGGNPMARMLDKDPECSPYFVIFGLYWYRVPGRTLAEKGRRDTLNALRLTRSLSRRLQQNGADLRRVTAFKFPPPWGRQLRELRVRRARRSSAATLRQIAADCERGARLLAARENILREQTSARRKPRNAMAMVLWLHMCEKLGKQTAGALLTTLVDCADAAFDISEPMQQWAKFDLACKRYLERFPQDYQRRQREAKRSREKLPPQQAAMWRRLNPDDCRSIVQSLQPRFDREVLRIKGRT